MNWKSCMFIMLVFLGSCGQGDTPPEKDKIIGAAFAGKETVWVITRENDLIQLSSDGSKKEWENFDGKAKLVFFLNNQNGWVFDTEGNVWSFIKDGNWEVVGSVTKFGDVVHASKLIFYDNDNGWISTSYGLLKTNNGGKTWREISPPSEERNNVSNVTGFYPKDGQSGWLIFHREAVAYTEDDGANWQFTHFGMGTKDTWSISCRKHRTCLIGTGGGGLYSFDYYNKEKPKQISEDLRDYAIKSISFSTNEKVWIAGIKFAESPDKRAEGIIMRSEDEGKNWETLEPPEENNGYMHVSFIDQENGWLVSGDSLYNTTNRGREWKKVTTIK